MISRESENLQEKCCVDAVPELGCALLKTGTSRLWVSCFQSVPQPATAQEKTAVTSQHLSCSGFLFLIAAAIFALPVAFTM